MEKGKRKFSYPLDRKALAKHKKIKIMKEINEHKRCKNIEYCRCRNQVRRLTRKAIKLQEKDIAKKSQIVRYFGNSSIQKLNQQFQNYILSANLIQTK